MRFASRRFVHLGAAVLVGAALAVPAAAVPIVYTMQGTLLPVGESDSLNLAGARLVVVATADTDDAPAGTTGGSGLAAATYDPASLTATFSSRPGGAPEVMLAYASQLQALNRFSPGTTADGFGLFSAATTFEGTEVVMPAFSVFFLDQTFFPGTGAPPLPLFAPGNVASVAGGFLSGGGSAYTLGDRSATAVPEPGAALGIVLDLGMLAVTGRRR
jgi:hypothetical protein